MPVSSITSQSNLVNVYEAQIRTLERQKEALREKVNRLKENPQSGQSFQEIPAYQVQLQSIETQIENLQQKQENIKQKDEKDNNSTKTDRSGKCFRE